MSFVAGHSSRLALLILLLAFAGCGGDYSAAAHRVDPEAARNTLVAVLDSWKAGDKPDIWQQKSPSVVIQDFDWMGGTKLTSYEILTTKAIDANLHCQVKLSLTGLQKSDSEKTVTYLVSTSPVLTVFRAAAP